MVSYEDVAGAIEWLGDAFGFREEGQRFTDEEGRVTHAQLELDGAVVMIGWPGPDYRSPAHHAQEGEQARRWLSSPWVCGGAPGWLSSPWVVEGAHVSVDDVDRHFERAKAAGASILRELEDLPFGRLYSAADLEGHRWMFMQPT